MHWAIYGATGTGKSWGLKRTAKPLLKHKQQVLCWSGVGDPDWPRGVKLTFDEDELEKWLRDPEHFGAYVFLDEAADLFKDTKEKTHPQIWRLARKGRHRGFTAFYATQYPTGLPPQVRTNCQNVRCFRLQNEDYAARVVRDYGLPKSYLSKITELPKLHYFEKRGGEDIALKRL